MRRGRVVRPSAHDWKSCIPKGIEGSNPSLSAISLLLPQRGSRSEVFMGGIRTLRRVFALS